MNENLTGKLVRWDNGEQWFTARVTGKGSGLPGSLAGKVVDPGTYVGPAAHDPHFTEMPLSAGQELPNLLPELITVVEENENTDSKPTS